MKIIDEIYLRIYQDRISKEKHNETMEKLWELRKYNLYILPNKVNKFRKKKEIILHEIADDYWYPIIWFWLKWWWTMSMKAEEFIWLIKNWQIELTPNLSKEM